MCSRRAFLHGTAGCLGGALALAAMLPASLRALPVRVIDSDAAGAADDRAFPLPTADGVTIDRQTSVILVREQGKVWAMSLACPHEHAAVKWVDKEQKFRCTKHDSQYEATGKYLSGRSTRNLDRFPVRRDGDRILVTVDTVFRADQNAAGWAAAEIVL